MASPRAFTFKCSPSLAFSTKTLMDSKPRTLRSPFSCSTSGSPQREARSSDAVEGAITLQEWQGWGTTSPLPAMVTKIVEDLKALEKDIDAQMSFGGSGGKLQGDFKVQEDKKHRKTYQALGDSEQKLQFFAARQIACRLLGSRGYLCQKCWLPLEDCMCSNVTQSTLWHRMRFWLYMHPKDFLRQNNTGKLLWQVFGTEAATLCLFGISEHEEIMWNALKLAGKNNVWCLYPNKNAALKSVEDVFGQEPSPYLECTDTKTNEDGTLNFILIDGTWNNSVSIFSRLKDQAMSVWGEADFPCISLATGVSAMHKLRPQPSWDRTCTAGAAIGLLSELQLLPEFSSFGFDKQAEALEDTLVILLEALTTRRVRMGRSITRKTGGSIGRSLLQAKQNCPVNFENQNYTIITSKCKGPNYPAKSCCNALKDFACPFADAINDLKNDCATTMFSYINIYGKYPPGLFASQCREGKEGLACPAEAPKPQKSRGQIAATHSITLALAAVLVLSFNMF